MADDFGRHGGSCILECKRKAVIGHCANRPLGIRQKANGKEAAQQRERRFEKPYARRERHRFP